MDALPPIVSESAARYVAALEHRAPGLLAGFYVIGSAAMGDFRPGASDLDFVAVLRRPLLKQDLRRLRPAEASARRSGAPALDGLFVAASDLQRDPLSTRPGWWTRSGRLRGPSMEMRTPVVWAELARNGRAVLGPGARELGIHTGRRELDAWTRDNLRGYWPDWIARARPVARIGLLARFPRAVIWGALGVSRLHCTLATGEIVSKTAAGHYGLERFGESSRLLLQLALDLRAGRRPGRRERGAGADLLRFMTHVVDDALQLPTPGGEGRRLDPGAKQA